MEIERKLKQLIRCCRNRDYRFLLLNQVPFDKEYFCRVANLPMEDRTDPLWHYVQSEHAARAEVNFRTDEWRQLPSPHALFDVFYYLAKYFPDGIKGNAFTHYLREGWLKGFSPGPYFDPEVYKKNSSWKEELGNPLGHYTNYGATQAISPSAFFAIDYYLDKTAFLSRYKKNIIRHHKMYGAGNCKSGSPVFDPEFYLKNQEENSTAKSDPFSHFLTASLRETLRPNEWFDPLFYSTHLYNESNPDKILIHYLTDGVYQQKYTDRRVERLEFKPLISIVVPVYNPPSNILNCCIRSVLYQAYPHWELCLADDCSTDGEIRKLLNYWAAKDARIKLIFNRENQGISKTTNAAANLATGEYIGFLDNDDEISPGCLYHIAETINKTKARVIYTDEDLVGDDSSRHSTFYKPDFNLNLLYSHNYITHFVVVDKELFWAIGGLNSARDGAQDYDLILRLSEETEKIAHIPRVLYHWRALDSSTSLNHDQKSYAHEAGRLALQETLDRRGILSEVDNSDTNFFYRTRYKLVSEQPSITILFPYTKSEEQEKDRRALEENTFYENCEYIGISTATTGGKSEAHSAEISTEPVHMAAISSQSDYLVFLGGQVTRASGEWLHELISSLIANHMVGIVCGNAEREEAIVKSYTIPDLNDLSAGYFASFLSSRSKHFNGLHCQQLVSCCNGDICIMEKAMYYDLGGLDYEQFPYDLAMLDLSLRAGQSGIRVLYSPFAKITMKSSEHRQNHSAPRKYIEPKKLFQTR